MTTFSPMVSSCLRALAVMMKLKKVPGEKLGMAMDQEISKPNTSSLAFSLHNASNARTWAGMSPLGCRALGTWGHGVTAIHWLVTPNRTGYVVGDSPGTNQ